MKVLDIPRILFQRLLLMIAPLEVDVDGVLYDAMVIHDDDTHPDIITVRLNDLTYGLIHRRDWEDIEDASMECDFDIAALDDPSLARELIALI